MKDKDFTLAIHDLFKKINKAYHKTIKDFDAEVIHDFRVDIKKLRGLLGLVNYHYNNIITLGLTKKIKTFYGYVGIVRNLQIQQVVVQEYCHSKSLPLPENYLHEIRKEEIYWKKQATDYMSEGNNFWEDEEQIIKDIPPQLNEKASGKYVREKMNELDQLLPHLKKDEPLHNVRKLLKNIQYTWKFIPHSLLAAGLQNKEDVEAITNLLGQFRDKCIAISHLQEAALASISNQEEKELLHQVENYLRLEKLKIKKQATNLLAALLNHPAPPSLSLHSPLSI